MRSESQLRRLFVDSRVSELSWDGFSMMWENKHKRQITSTQHYHLLSHYHATYWNTTKQSSQETLLRKCLIEDWSAVEEQEMIGTNLFKPHSWGSEISIVSLYLYAENCGLWGEAGACGWMQFRVNWPFDHGAYAELGGGWGKACSLDWEIHQSCGCWMTDVWNQSSWSSNVWTRCSRFHIMSVVIHTCCLPQSAFSSQGSTMLWFRLHLCAPLFYM